MRQKQGRGVYVRTTLQLAGSIATTEAKLDHVSRLALDYSRARLKAELKGVDPTTSGVIRRALQHYARHLGRPEAEHEAAAVRWVCACINPEQAEQEAASRRLEAAGQGNPFPSFHEVLHGPAKGLEVAALDAQADALVEQLQRERRRPRARELSPVHVDRLPGVAP